MNHSTVPIAGYTDCRRFAFVFAIFLINLRYFWPLPPLIIDL